MQTVSRILRKIIVYVAVVVLAGGAPLAQVVAADTTPVKSGNYTYNPDTQHWDSKTWRWDPAQNKYVRIAATSSPSPSPSASPAPKNSSAPEGTSTNAAQNASPTGSDATVTQNTNGSATTNDNTNASVTNNLDSNASTGSADVHRNTAAGDARTGNASADTTIINSVHSTVGDGENSGVAHFTTNLYGDIVGDITIGPNIDNARIDKNTNLSSTTNVNNNDQLVNNQTLQATSGDASVRGNTTGGSAVSGNANTVANVLNLINTIIAANKSFVGTINIYGNLNGDILVSPDFIPQLLASNAQVVGNYNMPLSMTTNDDQSIVNNVKLNATTGTAAVKNNTTAGNAQTGTAQTNLTILNLTGHQVDASKSLLVFVNVLGKWVGMIVDAPGATSAALGSGVITDNTTLSSTANLNNNVGITNNLDLSSASGNATVAGNTKGGDAVTGNATASANIANISTSQFNLSDWFGVLYINVFGSWIGSFGIDTAAGTITPLSGDAVAASAGVAGAPNLHFGFRPATHTSSALSAVGGGGSSAGGDTAGLVSAMQASRNTQPILQAGTSPHEDPFSLVMMITGFTIAGASGIFWIIRRWAVYRTAVA